MIDLVRPTADLFLSWAAAVSEFDGEHIAGSGLADHTEPGIEACQALIEKERAHSDPSTPLPPPLVHCNYWWITDDQDGGTQVVGFIALRHRLTDALRDIGGHIGYAVRPSRRREGIATCALGLVLDRARQLGLDSVLLTCDYDNEASARTIERCGGRLQDTDDERPGGAELVRHYWIQL